MDSPETQNKYKAKQTGKKERKKNKKQTNKQTHKQNKNTALKFEKDKQHGPHCFFLMHYGFCHSYTILLSTKGKHLSISG
jgi:hypothetical protein